MSIDRWIVAVAAGVGGVWCILQIIGWTWPRWTAWRRSRARVEWYAPPPDPPRRDKYGRTREEVAEMVSRRARGIR